MRSALLGIVAGMAWLAVGSPAFGATWIVPADRAETFGDGAKPVLFDGAGRFQQVYAASEFAALGQPIEISHVHFRAEDFYAVFSESVTLRIQLSRTPVAPDEMAPEFSRQLGPGARVVFDGPAEIGSRHGPSPSKPPTPALIGVRLASPFRYDPALGNLVLDIAYEAAGASGHLVDAVSGSGVVGFASSTDPLASHADLVEPGVGLTTRFSGTLVGSFPARLVADVNQSKTVAGTMWFPTLAGDRIVFQLETEATGRELWVTDGTESGTHLVREVRPGVQDSFISGLTSVGDFALFGTVDPVAGREPFITDGTAEGTHVLKDLTPGIADTSFGFTIDVGSVGYFRSGAEGDTYRIWRTDGTEAGTVEVATFERERSWHNPGLMTPGETRFYFAMGQDVWVSDGTQAGTHVAESDAWQPSDLCTAGDRLFFVADVEFTGENEPPGRELWTSDGTAEGTRMVVDLWPGPEGSEPTDLVATDDRVYFHADDGVHGRQLWTSDGTAEGTWVVHPDEGLEVLGFLGGEVIFAETETAFRPLWRTDGTLEGTSSFGLLLDIEPLNDLVRGDLVFFVARSIGVPPTLWRTDGTAAGTFSLDIAVPLGGKWLSLGDRFYGVWGGLGWVLTTDGTVAGTHRLEGIGVEDEPADPRGFGEVGGRAVAAFREGQRGPELWQLEGLKAEYIVPPSWPPAFPFGPFTRFGDALYFQGTGNEPWRTDGTAEGSWQLKDIRVGQSGSYPEQFVALDDMLLFVANDRVIGEELWRSDGTEEGTTVLADIVPGPGSSGIRGLTRFGDGAVFAANEEPWITDGTAEGTRLLRQLYPSLGSHPRDFVALGDIALFTAFSSSGREIYRTDGTEVGTVMVTDINPVGSAEPWQLVAMNGDVYFRADDGLHGLELWASDGTPAGTRLVADIAPGAEGSYVSNLVVSEGQLYFGAREGDARGSTLWVSDGTTEGTRPVHEIVPGPFPDFLSDLTPIEGGLAYQACSEAAGCELWVTDGTDMGTRLLADVAPGPASSGPTTMWTRDGWLYFAADDQMESGRELFAVELGTCGDGDLGPVEHCDDGNRISGDGCSETCRAEALCNDGVDNDGDGRIDYGDDPGCLWFTGPSESPSCSDGIDNDGDGRVDHDGAGLGPPDLACNGLPWSDAEAPGGCEGSSFALAVPALLMGWRRSGLRPKRLWRRQEPGGSRRSRAA